MHFSATFDMINRSSIGSSSLIYICGAATLPSASLRNTDSETESSPVPFSFMVKKVNSIHIKIFYNPALPARQNVRYILQPDHCPCPLPIHTIQNIFLILVLMYTSYILSLTLALSNSPIFPMPAKLHFSATKPSSTFALNIPLAA